MKKGIALEYNGKIPKILAIAKGKLFKDLLYIAKKNNITIYEDTNLVEVLSKLDVGEEIPEDMYHAISGILAYCYNVNENFKQKFNNFL
jgi:flagellar biosynthesis protein